MGERVVTINDVLDGHTVLDISCLDRLYLSGFVQKLQTPGGVVFFLHQHRGMPIASPAVFEQIGSRFRDGMRRFAEDNHIPVVRFGRDDRKIEVMRPHLDRAATMGRSQVAAIGVAQEFAPVWTARRRDTDPAKPPQFSFTKEQRRVTVFYVYVWDDDFGPAFIKICSYFPYPIKVWVNGHEWAKRQATKAGIGFTELSNGFATAEDPAALQAICDRLGPGTIRVFFERWTSRLPLPLWAADRDGGFWWDLTMRQVETSRTIVLDAPATPGAASVETSRPALGPQTMRNARSVEGQQRYANGQLSTLLSAAPTSGPCLAWAGVTGDPCIVPSAFTLLPRAELAHG
jgi:hypothetical protein